MQTIDFGKTALDYRHHRAGFPDEFFDRMASQGVGLPGQRMLDLGTGTGTVARGFARRGCVVTALDPSPALMEQAKELDAEAGVSIDYRLGKAEQTEISDSRFDVVVAGQCWHWFDRSRAAAEARRVLQTDGVLAIAHFDWLPLAGTVVQATEALILKHNPDWKGARGTGIYPWWFADLSTAGFRQIESFSFDVDVAYTHDAWRGRIRASAGIAASLAPAAVDAFDREHAALLQRDFPREPLHTPHRVFAIFGKNISS